MIQLIYGSTATHAMSENELVDILETSHRNNERRNITGMLMYYDQSFMQVLEGDAHEVDRLFATIQQDTRHQAVNMFSRRKIDKREFPEWKMAFTQITDDDIHRLEGYSNIIEQSKLNSDIFLENPTRAATFLRVFLSNLR